MKKPDSKFGQVDSARMSLEGLSPPSTMMELEDHFLYEILGNAVKEEYVKNLDSAFYDDFDDLFDDDDF